MALALKVPRLTCPTAALLLLGIGCGRMAPGQPRDTDAGPSQPSVGRAAPGQPFADGSDAGPSEGSADTSFRDVALVLGTMAFNEPMNVGYFSDRTPTWSSDGLLFAPSGRLSGFVTVTAAGPVPNADAWRDVLFWNVVGEFPFGQDDSQILPLSPIAGVAASTSEAARATFSIQGAFDLSVTGGEGTPPMTIEFALTWVRVYRSSGTLQYQVLPGWRDAGDGSLVQWDRSTGSVSGPLGYYAPLMDSPGLGSDFDYPSWIRAHVSW